jgi:hypothetical protein
MSKAGGAEDVLVDDAEDVARLCLNERTDIDPETRLLKVSTLMWEDFLHRGLSVQRVNFFTRGDAQAALDARIAAREGAGKSVTGYALAGVAIARVEKIRRIEKEGGSPAFVVVEKPDAASAGHAEIFATEDYGHGKFLGFRTKLILAFGPVQSVEMLPEAVLTAPTVDHEAE